MKHLRMWCIAFITLDRLAWRLDNHGKMIQGFLEREALKNRTPESAE
jgi:hypothetical protein